METRRLGASGLRVSRLGLGTMAWGAAVDEYVAHDQLVEFHQAGGTLIDTSPIYGDGNCETLLGHVLERTALRDEFVLAGKAGLGLRNGEAIRDSSRRTLLDQLDVSLRDLRTDHLDIWQIHRYDESTPMDEAMSTLSHAVTTGRVRYAGISNYSGWQTALAHQSFSSFGSGSPLVSTQVEYSLLERRAESEVLPAAGYLGMGVLCWSALGRGVLTGKYRAGIPADSRGADAHWEGFVTGYLTPAKSRIVEAVAKAAEGLGVPVSHVSLSWVRDQPLVSAAIIGARTVQQLHETLSSEQLVLPPEIHDALSDVSQGA